jgi:hypothetical protein
MMNAAVVHENLADGATNLNANTSFSDIKWDEASQWNTVYCPVAKENFRAGESVELDPPMPIIGTNFSSRVGAILRVCQQGEPQRVLLSLFISLAPEMGVPHQDSPQDRDYLQYPAKQIVWTRYQGWYSVTGIRREAFVVTPWEINAGLNHTQVALGMNNAYCVVAKWHHDALLPGRAFRPLGHDKILIPGCLNLINFDSVTQRYWSFRSTVALKVADILSRSSLPTCPKASIHLENITQSHWDNFKKRTIPLENTERKGIVTTRAIRKHLAVEMLRNSTIKQFARFDTVERLDILKSYFGGGIQGAGRIRRFAGPKFSRTGPAPAFCARRLHTGDAVGGLVELPVEPTIKHHSNKPGIDLMYCLVKRQLTIRLRYRIKKVRDAIAQEQLLGVPPVPPPLNNNIVQEQEVLLIPDESQFMHDGTLFLVRDFTVDGIEVVCEVSESGNDGLNEGDELNLPMDVVKQGVRDYLYDSASDSDDDDE